MTDQVASEAVFWTKTGVQIKLLGERVRRARLEAVEAEKLDSSKPEVTYVTSVLQTPCNCKLIG